MRVLYKKLDGSIILVHPAPEMFNPNSGTRLLLKSRGIDFSNDTEIMNFILAEYRNNPEYSEETEIEEKDVPNEYRMFRTAWKLQNKKITHDINKCHAILRDHRNRALKKLDVEAFRTQRDPKSNIAKIDSEAQELRDLPTKFSSDVDELKDLHSRIQDITKQYD